MQTTPASIGLGSLFIVAGAVACYIFLALLPIYFRQKSAGEQRDPQMALLQTASLLLFLVGAFLTAFTLGIRQAFGAWASPILGIEAAAYFLIATLVLVLAQKRAGKAPA